MSALGVASERRRGGPLADTSEANQRRSPLRCSPTLWRPCPCGSLRRRQGSAAAGPPGGCAPPDRPPPSAGPTLDPSKHGPAGTASIHGEGVNLDRPTLATAGDPLASTEETGSMPPRLEATAGSVPPPQRTRAQTTGTGQRAGSRDRERGSPGGEGRARGLFVGAIHRRGFSVRRDARAAFGPPAPPRQFWARGFGTRRERSPAFPLYNSPRTLRPISFAWAADATPACCSSLWRVRAELSSAKSRSMIWDSALERAVTLASADPIAWSRRL